MPGSFLLLRHAQSEWNALGLWQGQADPPLSAHGRRQAAVAATRIASELWFDGFDLVVSSDLARAAQTAEILGEELGLDHSPVLDEGLREYDAGEWSGHTLAEIEARWPGEVERFTQGLVSSPPGGEDRRSFDARVAEAAHRLAALADRTGARGLLVVAHGGVVGAVARSAGLVRAHTGHLAGYRGRHDERGLFPEEPVDLLEAPELAVDSA
jgi:broad specificity phosphatase PhoE